jgi:CDP-glucose 4,6-dehydratase
MNVVEMTRRILTVMGSDLEPDVRATAHHEIAEQSLSAEKARQELGWRAEWDVDSGLRRTVEWYREYLAEVAPPRATPAVGGVS